MPTLPILYIANLELSAGTVPDGLPPDVPTLREPFTASQLLVAARALEEHLKILPQGHSRWLEFVHPAGDAMTQWHITWGKVTLIENPEYDLAIVGMPRSTSPNGRARTPLPFPETLEIEVGHEVGAYGFPFGSALMTRDVEGQMRPIASARSFSRVSRRN